MEISMTKQEWFDLFKHPEWQKKRLKVLERDEFACVRCGDNKATLNVHHTFYWDKEDEMPPWEYNNNSLVTLCDDCHDIEHQYIYNARMKLIRNVSHHGLGTSENIERLAEGFEFSIGQFDEFESDVLAFGIQLLLASRTVYKGVSIPEKNAIFDERLSDINGTLWGVVRDRFNNPKQNKKSSEIK